MWADLTAWGIGAGVVGTAAFAGLKAFRQRTFDTRNTVIVFLGLFGSVTGINLIRVAFVGDKDSLPSSWREYLTVAAILGIGLSVEYLLRAFKSVLRGALPPQEDYSADATQTNAKNGKDSPP